LRELWDSKLVRWAAPFAWMGFIFFLSAQSRLPSVTPGMPEAQEIGGHLVVYAILALLWERALLSAGVRRAAWWTMAIVVLHGIGDEYHQSFVPGRAATVFDIVIDAVAGALAMLVSGWFRARTVVYRSDQSGRRTPPTPDGPASLDGS
jgi:hypothetical protein